MVYRGCLIILCQALYLEYGSNAWPYLYTSKSLNKSSEDIRKVLKGFAYIKTNA